MRGNVHLVFAFCMIFLAANNTVARRCDRTPEGYTVGRTPADGRFILKVSGNGSTYVPNTIYTVTLKAQSNLQVPTRFTGFLIVAEPEDSMSDSFVANKGSQSDAGTFSILGDSLTRISDKCPNAVTHSSTFAKSDVQVLWSSPPPGSGCVTLKATVIEHHDIWYMDEGPLSKTLCEDVEETFDTQPPIIQQCCACDEAKYEVTFEGLWSRHTHPKDFPMNGWLTRFSDVIGASHAAEYRFWDYNRQATEGLRQLAEHGATRVLESELKAESNHIRTIIKARGISYPNLTGKTFAVFRVDSRHHLMSLVSMIDPSPDWIVGVSGLELCNPNCSWVESKVLNLYPWDAGTDSGPTYISPDQPTTPRDVIRRIRPNFPNDPRSPFYDPTATDMKPLARLYLSRQRLYEKSCGDNNGVGTDDDPEKDPCAMGSWLEWSACSKTCGEGLKTRQRYYLSTSRAESAGCDREITQQRKCRGHRKKCRQDKIGRGENEEEDNFEELPERLRSEYEPDPAQRTGPCALTHWSSWSGCSVECGTGVRVRARKFRHKGAFKRCHQGIDSRPDLHQTITCLGIGDECPTTDEKSSEAGEDDLECQTTDWSHWSSCSATCGKGRMIRTRQLIAKDENQMEMLRRFTRMNKQKRALWRKEESSRQVSNEDGNEEMSQEENNEEEEEDEEKEERGNMKDICSKKVKLIEEVSCDGAITSCEIAEEDARSICKLPKVIGPCRSYAKRWFFDFNTKSCEPFGYTGCQGNRNNFRTQQECLRVCRSYREDLVRIEKILEENDEEEYTSENPSHMNNTVYDHTMQEDEAEAYYGREQFAGLDTRNQMSNRHPVAGVVSSAEVTGDGSLSGYDGPTNSPGSRYNNDIDEDDRYNSKNNWKPSGRHPENDRPAKRPKYPEREDEEEKPYYHRKPGHNGSAHRKDKNKKPEDDVEDEDGGNNKQEEENDNNQFVNKHHHGSSNERTQSHKIGRPKKVHRNSKEDSGKSEEKPDRRPVDVIEKPVGQIKDCKVTQWSEWSECSATCGRAFITRSRQITQYPVNGGKKCPKKLMQRTKCSLKSCRKHSDEYEDEEEEEEEEEDNDGKHNSKHHNSMNPTWGPGNPISNARVDCIPSSWSTWSPCSETCGMGVLRHRTRSVIRPASGGGAPCYPRIQQQSCDLFPCPL